MGVPVFKGERAFEILNDTLDGIIKGLDRHSALPAELTTQTPWFIGSDDQPHLITETEIGLIEDIKTRLQEHKDTGLTRKIVFDTLFDALPGVNLPHIDPTKFERVGQKINQYMGAIFKTADEGTMQEKERDALAKVFNIIAIPENNKFGMSEAAVKWVGEAVIKLDRAFSETWHTAWSEAHSGVEGAPSVDEVQGLEDVFVPPSQQKRLG